MKQIYNSSPLRLDKGNRITTRLNKLLTRMEFYHSNDDEIRKEESVDILP